MQFLSDNCQLNDLDFVQAKETLKPYIKQLEEIQSKSDLNSSEAFICLPSEKSILNQIDEVKAKINCQDMAVFINIGIGGSNLGSKAVYDCNFGYFDSISPTRMPKMIFVDTCDPEYLYVLQSLIQKFVNFPKKILFNVISKSGTTTETVANFSFLTHTFVSWRERTVITTDKGSKLWELAQKLKVPVLEIPAKVGGRYSIFSPVGLFPLSCVGIDIKSFLNGAKEVLDRCLSADIWANPALNSAAIMYLYNKSWKSISDTFLFHPEMESLGKWYRQLLAESIGKENDSDGKLVKTGITPMVTIGSTDLHSIGQLNLAGPEDKVTTFVYTQKDKANVFVPDESEVTVLAPQVKGKSAKQIMQAILQGTKKAYEQRKLPFMENILEDLSDKSLGQWMQFKMMEVIFLAKLLNINAFDQPNVEEYKVETKKLLTS